ncbi:MAG: NAD(P)-dependent oxidoreductase [Pseudomonadota bacterium]
MLHLKAPSDGGALSATEIEDNFADLHPPLSATQAEVEAARCLYCFDAPCIAACPTAIDIPRFIHQIRTGNLDGSARTILSANIMGGTCARACPTEVLCEQSCVVNKTEGGPVKIGQMQRRAVDHLLAKDAPHPFERAPKTGRRLAVVGAGPAGLSFAHRAAMLGHDVTVFEARPKPGGLNEYGLAAYKMVEDFAQAEVAFLLGVGGIEIKYNQRLGEAVNLNALREAFDAVFLSVGLSDPSALDAPGSHLPGVRDALGFIEDLRQADDLAKLEVGADVVVIGGGNTAIDAAVQAKRLGARSVTLAYRRGPEQMGATKWEQDLAQVNGVIVRHWSSPVRFSGEDAVSSATFRRTRLEGGALVELEDEFTVPADQVLLAVGQKLRHDPLAALERDGAKIRVGDTFETSASRVYAGGDCIRSGEDLTVQAVEDGKRAAHAVDAALKSNGAAH